MPIENSEKVSVSVNKVRYLLKSIGIFIMLQPIYPFLIIHICKAVL